VISQIVGLPAQGIPRVSEMRMILPEPEAMSTRQTVCMTNRRAGDRYNPYRVSTAATPDERLPPTVLIGESAGGGNLSRSPLVL